MTVKEIIKQYLEREKFDGLCAERCECACLVDDLAPCESMQETCAPGYRVECDCGDHDFHITTLKPAPHDYQPFTTIDDSEACGQCYAPKGHRVHTTTPAPSGERSE